MDKNISGIGKDCVGCGNCQMVCPKVAISLEEDVEGFLYPIVDEAKCVNCGVCQDKCPQEQVISPIKSQKGYIAISMDKVFYRNGASGGIFGTIANEFLASGNAYVCGAAYLEGMVKHIIIKKERDLRILQNSKYVQSYLGNIFDQIRDILNTTGEKVLFSGTPCQVNALRTFIGEHDNLYTIDIVCHGVSSPAFFQKDITSYKLSDIDAVSFRKKHKFYKSKSNYFLALKQEGGKKVVGVPYNRDPYFNLFMEGKTFRYSCYKCHYANLNRVGDITLGDCDSASNYPNFHADEATSIVLINSSKGDELFHSCDKDIDFADLDIQIERSRNHQLDHPFEKPKERETIYNNVNEMDVKELRNKYAKPYTIKGRVYQIANTIFPHRFVSKIIRKS